MLQSSRAKETTFPLILLERKRSYMKQFPKLPQTPLQKDIKKVLNLKIASIEQKAYSIACNQKQLRF
jgi:hypothetical protein